MSLKEVANEDMLLNFVDTLGPPDLAYGGDPGIDAVKVVPILSTKCKATGKKIGVTSIAITWSVTGCPFTSGTHVFIAGAGSVVSTAAKVRAEAQSVLRKDDIGTCAGTWQPPGGPPPPPIPCACNVKISDAGQAKVKAA